MTQNVFLLEFFEYPSNLFKDIASNLEALRISPDGIISFLMPIGNRQKEFKFQAQEKMTTPEDKLIRLMSQMKMENEKRFRCLEEEIMIIRKEMKDKAQVSKY